MCIQNVLKNVTKNKTCLFIPILVLAYCFSKSTSGSGKIMHIVYLKAKKIKLICGIFLKFTFMICGYLRPEHCDHWQESCIWPIVNHIRVPLSGVVRLQPMLLFLEICTRRSFLLSFNHVDGSLSSNLLCFSSAAVAKGKGE